MSVINKIESQLVKSNLSYNDTPCMLFRNENKYHDVYNNETKTVSSTHRAICIHYHGQPPEQHYHVNHLCCNPGCCNPEHLEWVTPKDNIAYSYTKGNRKMKLSRRDIDIIRQSSEKNKVLAIQYDCTPAYISYIKNNKRRTNTW